MRDEIILPLWLRRLLFLFSIFIVSCVPDPVPPPAPEDLEERNQALEELRAKLAFMKQATPEQVQGLLEHRDFRVRARAARRLGEQGNAAAATLPALAKLLRDESREVRIETATALGAIGNEASIEPLLETLVDGERKVRFWGWKAIRRFGSVAYPVLIQHLKADSPYAKRYYKDEAGNKYFFQTELGNRLVALGTEIIPHLTGVLSLTDNSLQVSAIKALAGFGDQARKALPALAEVLTSNDDVKCQIEVIQAMKKIGDIDPVVVPSLLKAAKSPHPKVAKEAKGALQKMK